MNRAEDFDVVVLGGGMTGLALAHHLAEHNAMQPAKRQQTLVIEPRSSYVRDKTWCYWQHESSPFDAAISHRWHRWSVSYADQTHIGHSDTTPYVRVDSAEYYAIAQQQIACSDSVTLRLGDRATAVCAGPDGVRVTCEAHTVQARQVIDTRPTAIPAGTLLQHFCGWEIETDTDVFDPTTVTLMDFAPAAVSQPASGDIHFFYVLPFSPRHALVETTHFSPQVSDQDSYTRELRDYLQSRFGLQQWQIRHREQGVIPMPKQTLDLARRRHANIIPMGLHSDTAKASTGYCYPHAQRQALRHVAALFARQDALAVPARSKLSCWFDGVFIDFLEQHPELAGEVFLRLFTAVPSDALIRFLSDRARPDDYLRVMTALPKRLFIRLAYLRAVSA